MLFNKKVSLLLIFLLLLVVIFISFGSFKVKYNITSKVKIMPSLEWELSRTVDGNLISVNKNHVQNIVNNYSVTEFQRGDVVKFELNPDIVQKELIKKGDTIGFVYSNEEQRKLIEMLGNLKILQAEFEFYTTGQKPEDVDKAYNEMELAKKELETHKKLISRSEILNEENVISAQQYDIDLNVYKVKEMNYLIAKSNFESVSTGEKPEQAELIKSKIEAMELQIEQTKERINYFTLVSPIDGIISKNRYQEKISDNFKSEVLIKIINTNKKVGVAPIRLKDLIHFNIGNKAHLPKENKTAKIISLDNEAQSYWTESSIFLTFEIENSKEMNPNSFTDIKIYGEEIELRDLIFKMFDS